MAAAEPATTPVADAAPLTAEAFAALMAALGSFEPRPMLAAGVSGGADSMALCLLAADWVRARGGRLTALIVDHGLRVDAAAEAAATATRLHGLGIAAHVLPWHGTKPASGIQARARAARLGLLLDWCRAEGVLHLLLGHHAQDQRETVVLRLARGSGADGLAGMRPVVTAGHARLLRPLLTVEPARLKASLIARGLHWIEDPSNTDQAFARARLRLAWPRLTAAGVGDRDLDRLAELAGCAADALDAALAELLAGLCRLDPSGWACLDRRALVAAPVEIAWRALARVLAAVGGRAWLPARAAVVRLLGRLARAADGSVGCLARTEAVVEGGRALLFRERRGLPAPMAIAPGDAIDWDGRFALRLAPPSAPAGLTVAPLSAAAWRQVVAAGPVGSRAAVPWRQRPTLPALYDGQGVVCAPHLGFVRPDWPSAALIACYRPKRALTGSGYFTGRCF